MLLLGTELEVLCKNYSYIDDVLYYFRFSVNKSLLIMDFF